MGGKIFKFLAKIINNILFLIYIFIIINNKVYNYNIITIINILILNNNFLFNFLK